MATSATEKVPKIHYKIANKLTCTLCDYTTSRSSQYDRHLTTAKHIKHTESTILGHTELLVPGDFTCKICDTKYKDRTGLWRHSKTCNSETNNSVFSIESKNTFIEILIKENEEFKNIVLEVVKSNSDLQKQLIDVCKTNNNTINNINSNIHTNSHNKTFNLHFFLNEQCKDAMNISDFANSFELQLSDLESVGELGYVEGITKLIVNKLNSMDIYKRPVHCSDAKRETLYVKDDDKWEKEEKNNPKLRHAIKTVSFKNMKMANIWSDTYPESKKSDSHLNDKYMKLIKQSTGGSGEITDNENKIIRRIAKEIVIEKN
jgi:hypothetical protein